ncbi:YkgJ family cysteine cluster protein [Paludibaculum fermentans]|uniref:YkgJ family cysteine cluster protein n=1 Tax=Paludibaculum fermentans TaxID=1473598 RepID=UPI003EBC4B94
MSCGPKATELVQIVGQTMAEAQAKGGPWIVCRPGCAECCLGTFAISQSDAERLQHGLEQLSVQDPSRAARVRQRARAFLDRFASSFPGHPDSGLLDDSPEGQERFETFGEDVPCPALDPASQTCDLYPYRPVTCRTFGPAIRYPEGEIRACELCYQDATEQEIAAAAVPLAPVHLREIQEAHTIAAWALAGRPRRF